MDFANSLLQLASNLWGLASKPLGYICNLKDNVEALKKETRDLEAMSGDVTARVEREEEEARVQRTKQVGNWLGKVQKFFGEVDQILREARECDQIKCLSRWHPRSCWSSYKLGKRVDQLLNEARQLKLEKGEFSDFTSPLPRPPVPAMPMDETVGLDISLEKVWKWLMHEKQKGMIGLYGIGGVGKSTLMKMINNELLRANHGFDVVIWVVVSKQVNEDSFRDTIRKGLNINDESWERWSPHERVSNMSEKLTKKKFVLLIDDVWKRLDLSEIGVPRASLENGSKVVFTTRSKQVCDQMKADETCKVESLMPKEALTLFKKNVGKVLENCPQEIQDLAKDIAKECKGLPLALITVGRAMACREHPHEWHYALTTLRNKPHQLSGMEEVYHILEFSYNSLSDSIIKLCFLYCCLFPENYLINSHDLIGLWIGEGLLGDTHDVYNMRDEGEYILGSLKMACLLESEMVANLGLQYVKMHGVIRDMATWIARDHGKKENELLVIEKEEDMSTKGMSKWGEAEKVSLWGKWISNINQAPLGCSQLRTLIVRETKVSVLPGRFFESMAACLTVLDLSNNRNIKSFPEGICNLISLRYLNLSNTCIVGLPMKIRNLICLRWLLLNNTRLLIFTGALASLLLNVFSSWHSILENEEEVVEELGHKQDLTDLSIRVYKSSSALKIFQSFQRCIRRALIANCKDLTCIPISHSLEERGNFSHLEVLHLVNCLMLEKMEITQGTKQAPNWCCFPNLIEVFVSNCGFLDLSWLEHTPKLQSLKVEGCDSMEKIIGDGITREKLATSRLFSCLKFVYTEDLPKLKSICDHALLFPQGVEFTVWNCPGLRKLPLDSNFARGSLVIRGRKGRWEEFEWDPSARVTLELNGVGPGEEMTYGEAARKIKDVALFYDARIGFLPREPSD